MRERYRSNATTNLSGPHKSHLKVSIFFYLPLHSVWIAIDGWYLFAQCRVVDDARIKWKNSLYGSMSEWIRIRSFGSVQTANHIRATRTTKKICKYFTRAPQPCRRTWHRHMGNGYALESRVPWYEDIHIPTFFYSASWKVYHLLDRLSIYVKYYILPFASKFTCFRHLGK